LLRQFFEDMPGEVFIYFPMSWDWLLFACGRVAVEIVIASVSDKDTPL